MAWSGLCSLWLVAVLSATVIIQSSGDMGLISWGALTADNTTAAGNTLYEGDGTFYGQQGGQNNWGACSYGASVSNTLNLEWSTDVKARVAMNDDQFQDGLACGMCLYFRGAGVGTGETPLPATWQFGFVDNLCPECAYGSIDLDEEGDGRWKVEWFPTPCHVGNATFKYVMSGDTGNAYWFEFTVSDTRVPVQKVEISSKGVWYELRRTSNNMYAANGGPFDSWPLPLRLTSVLNDTVYDELPSKTGGQGTAQFPDHGSAVFPKAGTHVQATSKPPTSQALPSEAPTPTPAAPASTPVSPAASVFTAFVVPNYGQCGGSGLYCRTGNLEENQCRDAQWQRSSCNPGFTCQRQNASCWSCQPVNMVQPPTSLPAGLQGIRPSAGRNVPLTSPSSAEAVASLRSYMVAVGGQCGGQGFYCSTLDPPDCVDAQWNKSSCSSSHLCARHNASWWSCDATIPAGQSSAQSTVTAFSGPSGGSPPPHSPPPAVSPPPSAPAGVNSISSTLQSGHSFMVAAGGQCGGNTSYCSSLTGLQCKDAEWAGAQCTSGFGCQRFNAGWWQCQPQVTTFSGPPSGYSSGRKMRSAQRAP